MTTIALHLRIRADVEAAILSGQLAPGSQLPSEATLMARYGCARMTVNKALGVLARDGLLERRKRAGTFVARPRVHSMVLDIPDLAAQVSERGAVYRFELLERQIDAEGQILHLKGRHFADQLALAIEDRTVNLAAVPAILTADLLDQAPGTWLLEHVPWTEAESRISAIAAGPAEAAGLDLALGTACLQVDRSTWRGQDWVTQVSQRFPGSAYDLVARFGARGANG